MSTVDRAHQETLLSDEVYRRLKDYVLNDVLRPPERLQLAQLSKHFNVSITPIREALIRLAAEHIVDSKPGRGFFYRKFTPREQINLDETLFSLLKYVIEQRGQKPFFKPARLPNGSETETQGEDPEATPHQSALAREKLYAELAGTINNVHYTEIVGNLCERTRISRLLWLEQQAEASNDAAELIALTRLLRAGENHKALDDLRRGFQAKARGMYALAQARENRIYETHPLLRPG